MTSGDTHQIFEGANNSVALFGVDLNYSSGTYRLRHRVKNDAGVYTYGSYSIITDDWHAVEIEWQAASAAGANDGFMKLWVDGTLVSTVASVDSDTWTIERAFLGGRNSLDAGTSGTMLFDEFESRRTSYIGVLGSIPTATSTPTATMAPQPTSTPLSSTNTPLLPTYYIYTSGYSHSTFYSNSNTHSN